MTKKPANIESVRVAFEKSPTRSTIRHVQTLRMSDRTVWWILHENLSFLNPFKFAVVKELQEQYLAIRLAFAEAMLEMINEDTGIYVLTSEEAISTLTVVLIKKIRY